MSVYVDRLIRVERTRRWPFWSSCHLFADSLDELHVFAKSLGLQRQWFQHDDRLPHYDLHPRRRAAAIRMGAIEVDRHHVAAVMRANLRARQTPRELTHQAEEFYEQLPDSYLTDGERTA